MMMLFMCELILNCEMIPKHMTCSLKYPWRSPDARCTAITPKLTMLPFRCLFPFVSTYLWAGVDIRGGERETAISGPSFSEIPRVHFESFALSFCLAFPSHRPNIFWNHQTTH